MEVHIQANLDIMKYLDLENTFGQMVRCMRENGKTTKCTEEVLLSGEMERGTKANLFSTKERVMEHLNGKMEEFMKVNGKTVNNMELEYSQVKTTR